MGRGVRVPLSAGAIVPRDMTEREWASFLANQSAQNIRSDEATGYNVGEGVWFGRDTDGVIKMFIGDSAGNKVTWDGATLSITGSISLTNTVQTFTPTWSGFSAAPSGDISYINFGAFVMMWRASALTGTSNATDLKITNLPAAIKPATGVRKVPCIVMNNGLSVSGAAEPDSAGDIDFYIEVPNTADATVDLGANSFKNSGTKGLPGGWMIMYPLN